MSLNHNLYLVRHAQSEYNLAQLKAIQSEVESKEEEDLSVKFDTNLIDCPISELGQQQALEANKKLQDVNVTLVITSPLRRCLQTTQGIFKDHKNKPKVIVWPVVKEMLLSGCDAADDLDTLKKEFPDYDFSALNNFPIPELWLFYVFCKDNEVIRNYVDGLLNKYPNKDEAIKNAKYYLVEKLREAYPKTIEIQPDLVERTFEAKKALTEVMKGVKENEAVVVVAHSRFLEAFTAEGFDENANPRNAKWFYNCEVTPYNLEKELVGESL